MPPKKNKTSAAFPKHTEIMDTAAGAKAVRTADGTVISLEDSYAVLQRHTLKTPGIVAALHDSAKEAAEAAKLESEAQQARSDGINFELHSSTPMTSPPDALTRLDDPHARFSMLNAEFPCPKSPVSWGDTFYPDIPPAFSMTQVFRYAVNEEHDPSLIVGSKRVITQSVSEHSSVAHPAKRTRFNFDLRPDSSPISAAITPATLSTRKPKLRFTQRQEDKIAEGRKTAEWSFEAVFEAPTIRDGTRPPTGAIARLADIFSGTNA